MNEAFRLQAKKKKKVQFNNWHDSNGAAWASVKLPHAAVADLQRAVSRDPTSCLPTGWHLQTDPSTHQPFFTWTSRGFLVAQQWAHPALEGVASGFSPRGAPKTARRNAALAACELLASVNRLDSNGRSSAGGGGRNNSNKYIKKSQHMASPQELRRLAVDGDEWYILGKDGNTNAGLKGLRVSLTTCFNSYRWGKLSQSVQHYRHGRNQCVCSITLPSEVLDELPEIADAGSHESNVEQRCIVGEGHTRDLAESAALLVTCRALARLGLLVKNGAGTGGQESTTPQKINPFIVPFPCQHTKGFKSACTSAHVLRPAPTVVLAETSRERLSRAVDRFKSMVTLPEVDEEMLPTRMPRLLPGLVTGGAVEKDDEEDDSEDGGEDGEDAKTEGDENGGGRGRGEKKEVTLAVATTAIEVAALMEQLKGITPIGLREEVDIEEEDDTQEGQQNDIQQQEGGEDEDEEEQEEEQEEEKLSVKEAKVVKPEETKEAFDTMLAAFRSMSEKNDSKADTPKDAENAEDTSSDPSEPPAPPRWPTEAEQRATEEKAVETVRQRMQPFQAPDGTVVYLDTLAEQMRQEQVRKESTSWEWAMIAEQRRQLPVTAQRAEILNAIKNNRVVVLSGHTGCGKTTQVPQFILENWIAEGRGPSCDVLVTQPRRIAAISVAQRVAEERCERIGEHVGYKVRFETVEVPPGTGKITFATVGSVLRRMYNDPDLVGVTHVVIDEVHERDVNTDFLIIVLREMLKRRPTLTLIVMSATLDARLFADYFGSAQIEEEEEEGRNHGGRRNGNSGRNGVRNGRNKKDRNNKKNNKNNRNDNNKSGESNSNTTSLSTVIVNVPGKLYPIQRLPLERLIKRLKAARMYSGPFPKSLQERLEHQKLSLTRWQPHKNKEEWIDARDPIPSRLLTSTLEWIHATRPCGPGAVLVFLPGWKELEDQRRALEGSPTLGWEAQRMGSVLVHTLHSQISAADQLAAFTVPEDPSVLKIVLATNIAESSITIPDVVYVVDSGLQKQRQFDARTRTAALELVAISKQSMIQRRGRAGRVAPGMSISLYSSYDAQTYLPAASIPEMRRVPLTELCLLIKQLPPLGDDNENLCAPTFELALDAPNPNAVAAALFELRRLGALDSSECLTPLGRLIARLPVSPRSAKMLVLSSLMGCAPQAASLAALLSNRDPFLVAPVHQRGELLSVRQHFARGSMSDHCVLVEAYKQWEDVRWQCRGDDDTMEAFCLEHWLNHRTMLTARKVKAQLLDEMRDMGLPTENGTSADHHGTNLAMMKAVCAACLLPNLLQFKRSEQTSKKDSGSNDAKKWKFSNREDCQISMHPRSILSYVEENTGSHHSEAEKQHSFACYENKVQTSSVFFDVGSAVTPESLVIFADDASPWRPIFMNRKNRIGVMVCKWAAVVLDARSGRTLLEAREAVRTMLATRVLNPRRPPTPETLELLDALAQVLSEAEPCYHQQQQQQQEQQQLAVVLPAPEARAPMMVPTVLLKQRQTITT